MGIISNVLGRNTKPRVPIFVSKPVASAFAEFKKLTEQLQGKVLQKKISFPKELGEEHPFDFEECEDIYKNFGPAKGQVNRLVDFIVGGGFFVRSTNKVAEKIINTFKDDVRFSVVLRKWLRDACIKGTGFCEVGQKAGMITGLKVLDAKYMYVVRDEFGKVLGYNQYFGMVKDFDASARAKPDFEPNQIAIITIDCVGDEFYGQGLIHPMMIFINSILEKEKHLNNILRRKAEDPDIAIVGTKEEPPTQEEVNGVGAAMEAYRGKVGWAVGPGVEFTNFKRGNPGEKFEFPINHDKSMLIWSGEVPEVIMGEGNIAEGLAKEQIETLTRKAVSIQQEIEIVIEEDIFKRVLFANGLDAKVEFEWGQPSDREINERLDRVHKFMSLMGASKALMELLEDETVQLLELDVKKFNKLRKTEQEERKEEEEEPLPLVPGQNESCENDCCEHVDDDMSLKEWLGFNYIDFLAKILLSVEEDEFDNLIARTDAELAAGKFTSPQTTQLRTILYDGFKDGKSNADLARKIRKTVRPRDLFKMEDGEIVYDEEGNKILAQKAKNRPINIARTETTRLANEGAIRHFEDGGVEKVRFVATFSNRTCAQCDALNGKIFTVSEAIGVIPVHPMCRCTFVPVIEE